MRLDLGKSVVSIGKVSRDTSDANTAPKGAVGVRFDTLGKPKAAFCALRKQPRAAEQNVGGRLLKLPPLDARNGPRRWQDHAFRCRLHTDFCTKNAQASRRFAPAHGRRCVRINQDSRASNRESATDLVAPSVKSKPASGRLLLDKCRASSLSAHS